ncbi:lipid droplet-associated protein [Nakamurella sp.]|uniref:lipid droplet-associated protein n=1 Tax=Nakamurella sp. TaxID=1869182 RepID=UPI003B3A2522
MAITLPFPVRVAAGIVATGIQLVRSLPEELPAIPVALVGNAMRLSMKVQQEFTSLATRGDELLGGLIGGSPQEKPGWATFDEDEPPAPRPRTSAPAGKPTAAPAGRSSTTATPVAPARPPAEGRTAPEASSLPDPDTTAIQAAAEVSDAVVDLATHAAPSPTANGGPAGPATETDGSVEEQTAGPAVLPGYDAMTLSQVRGHLRDLSAADVTALLDYEQSGDNRAPFLTLLSNRLVTLGAQDS